MRNLTGSGTGLWVIPAIAAAFVAYVEVVGRLVYRGKDRTVVRFAAGPERKAA